MYYDLNVHWKICQLGYTYIIINSCTVSNYKLTELIVNFNHLWFMCVHILTSAAVFLLVLWDQSKKWHQTFQDCRT